MDNSQQGIVFNIQKFSVHDGNGIRTLVFLKGCPLRCAWCSNPESQKKEPERAFNPTRCIGAKACGRCVEQCPTGAMSVQSGRLVSDMGKCTQCFACVAACPSGAQTLYGERKTVDEVLQRVEEDGVFYSRSAGGLTLSGGEAMMQPEFTLSLLREARRRHLHTAMETCGITSYDALAEACTYLNELIYDIKHTTPNIHKNFTGVDNALILTNLHRIVMDFPQLPITVRTPVVPKFNDNWEAIESIYRILPKSPMVSYELLEFHRMGEPKYGYLGREFPYSGVTADRQLMGTLESQLHALEQALETQIEQDQYVEGFMTSLGVKSI